MAKKVSGKKQALCDKKWQAECDARTLMEAKVIQADRKRVNAACVAAKRMAKDKMAEAKAIEKIAKKKGV